MKKRVEKILRDILLEALSDRIDVGVSNRHLHLSKKDLDILFGQKYTLTKMKELIQPHQYVAKETVDLIGPKGEIKKVRVLGPLRDRTQVEISKSDSFKLGIEAPIRESGDLISSASIILRGPEGELKLEEGVIVAHRHIHMPKYIADINGYKDKEMVKVETFGKRKLVFHNVLLRVSEEMEREFHIDLDEANATDIKTGDKVRVIRELL